MTLKGLAEEFLFHCECRRLSQRTVKNYKKQIQYLLDYLRETYDITELEQVKPTHIKHFLMTKQRAGRKPAYINDLLKAYKCLFKYAYEEEYTSELLTKRIQNVKQPKTIIRAFNNEEIKNMLKYWRGNDYISIRNRTILAILFDTGLRLNELINLTQDRIKSDYFVILGKGEKERVVPKTAYVGKLLSQYLRVRESYFMNRNLAPNLFLSRYGKPLCSSAIEHMLKNTGEAVGVRQEVRISPHTCRHTFAQIQLMNGLDIYSLSRVLGHEHIYTTQTYLEGLQDSKILKESSKASPLMNL